MKYEEKVTICAIWKSPKSKVMFSLTKSVFLISKHYIIW